MKKINKVGGYSLDLLVWFIVFVGICCFSAAAFINGGVVGGLSVIGVSCLLVALLIGLLRI